MITKRQLGIFVVVVGLLITGAAVGANAFGAGRWSGFGPLQWLGVALGLACMPIGYILIRLGNRPA